MIVRDRAVATNRHPKLTIPCFFATALTTLTVVCPTQAAMNRFWLASQQDFGAKRGFYLDFENQSEGQAPSKLENLRLILAVGNGKQWRFPSQTAPWQTGHEYHVKAVLKPDSAEWTLDGKALGRSDSGFVPIVAPLSYETVPDWASGPAGYHIVQTSLRLSTGSKVFAPPLANAADRPPALMLFESGPGQQAQWSMPVGTTLTIETSFRIEKNPDLHALSPMIDPYGQSRYANWPGKIRNDADLKKSRQQEQEQLKAWGSPADMDAFGGLKTLAWNEKPTGFYHLARRGAYWWLISPDGNPCFYTGVCTAPGLQWETTPVTGREFLFEWLPPHTGIYAPAWRSNAWGGNDHSDYFAFRTSNLIRKFGANWEKDANNLTRQRLRAWGFSGIGKWGGLEGVPSVPVLGHGDVPNLVRHPDVFDPAVQAQIVETLRKQIAPRVKDPLVVGWSLGNEYDEIITTDEIKQILSRDAPSPSRRALVNEALEHLYDGDFGKLATAWKSPAKSVEVLAAGAIQAPPEDVEKLRRFYASHYYDFIYRTVKAIDPNHLYLGFWIVPGWWQNEEDWRLIAPYCDVIGYDRYSPNFSDEMITRLMKETDKPVLCGEFSFPPFYDGMRGFGRYGASWVIDDTAAGEAYQKWVEAGASSPYCVGVCWFEYHDEPLTGRGPGTGDGLVYGEHYAFGLIQDTGVPREELVRRVRAANLSASRLRWHQTAMSK